MKDKRIDLSFIAIEKQENETVKTLFKEVGIHASDRDGRTLLLNASCYHNLELVKFAVENGANINHQDKLGFTALHFAVQEQHVESITYLLLHKIEIDRQDKYGNSALWRAVMNDVSIEIIAILINNGANPNLQNNSEVSPIDLVDEDNLEMLQLFNL
ncbi:hypothetical protein KO02_13790 [Sphingobacterium sp. ML3W]|uniref:ankyrin repeat domain-containing protein n=1 Tax=Sphingobacterium sp. ML3W TaxID=1538644 RepID=UPI0004F6093B|nr:ankyrin repeat domain-containing protein [Sphingobacterium sp. ML3W]AIM37629.1 hypothetical protein KO02_13790 [Sphingobacterium sp. ML3W]